jgi:hypothetical protein
MEEIRTHPLMRELYRTHLEELDKCGNDEDMLRNEICYFNHLKFEIEGYLS